MDIVIAGGHGQIALKLEQLLTDAGHQVRGLIRNPDHVADVEATGAEALIADLEAQSTFALADLIADADAIVFAAGAGPGSGPERKTTVDYEGAAKLIDVAVANSIPRFVMISTVGADREAEDDGGFGTYLRAKGQADSDLTQSELDYTIVRPGPLTDDPGTAEITLGGDIEPGPVTRDDVAATIAAVLDADSTIGLTVDLRGGGLPIAEAISQL
ncbi:MAG: SDR family oxidoreductase [Solirubrobacterales bacterium]|nr:SDR family oxidoreductase [Solirubrobacterales bacterium]